ncbi:phage baseplate plug family protein [Providencia manganoxydans]|uniref:phage baseplate plug family protein n=1 Tax=Providencia manganoxydans TaxID=2923283 RepID=UPI0034E5B1AB
MNNVIEIPILNKNQELDIQLGRKNYHLRIKYMEFCGWVLDVMTQAKEEILMGIPLLHGVDIFGQYRYLGLEGSLLFYCEDPSYETDMNEAGKGNRLYFTQDSQ